MSISHGVTIVVEGSGRERPVRGVREDEVRTRRSRRRRLQRTQDGVAVDVARRDRELVESTRPPANSLCTAHRTTG